MTEDEVVEQTDIEKEAQYTQEYYEELRAAAKEYLPKTV